MLLLQDLEYTKLDVKLFVILVDGTTATFKRKHGPPKRFAAETNKSTLVYHLRR